MTQKEIKDKIADWKNRLKNPSVAGVPSAVTKINSEIAKYEAMLEKEEKPITLIPFGFTRLRVVAFPVVN